MADTPNNQEGFGFLYPVSAEKRVPNGPAMSGKATLNGREVDVACWTKTAKKTGVKYFSVKFQNYEASGEAVPEAADDDIPF